MNNLHPLFAGILGAWQSAPPLRQLPPPLAGGSLKLQANTAGTKLAKQLGMKKPSPLRKPRPVMQRCYVIEYHGNNRATFECRQAGHQFRCQMFPKAPNGKFPSEAMLVKFARYWGRHSDRGGSGGGAIMECPRCARR